MAIDIQTYLNDGANYKVQAIMCLLRNASDYVKDVAFDLANKNDEYKEIIRYNSMQLQLNVGRYENCREQGYVFTLSHNYHDVVHYCVFEHRNSDRLHIIRFYGDYINTPTIEEIWQGRKDKYDTDMAFSYNEVYECAEWVKEDMNKEFTKYLKDYVVNTKERKNKQVKVK